MSSTVATGAQRVEGRQGGRADEPDDGTLAILSEGGEAAVEDGTSRHRQRSRRLNEALAELGPAMPMPRIVDSPILLDASVQTKVPPFDIDRLLAAGEAPHPVYMPDWAATSIGEIGKEGQDLVRVLAEADLARGLAPIRITRDAEMEPAPMIIERARAEQQLGIMPAMPTTRHLDPLPGLLTGFMLAAVAGVALYFVMVAG
jgi:hypothetical protein